MCTWYFFYQQQCIVGFVILNFAYFFFCNALWMIIVSSEVLGSPSWIDISLPIVYLRGGSARILVPCCYLFLSHFTTFTTLTSTLSNTTGSTYNTGTPYPSGLSEFIITDDDSWLSVFGHAVAVFCRWSRDPNYINKNRDNDVIISCENF